jgi:hypothetical protein
MEVSGQLHAPVALPPRERAPGTHWIGGWVGPRAVLDAVVQRKISFLFVLHLAPIQWVPGALSLGVKRPGREADHSPE